jgi:NADH-quinone oxidoreductase subunit M
MPIVAILLLVPLLSSLLLFAVKSDKARNIALGLSTINFIITLVLLFQFDKKGGTQFILDYNWIQSLGIGFSVGIDGLSLMMVLLTTFLTPVIILSSFSNTYKNPNVFYGLILLMEMALIGVFVARDGFLFYVFWELALIPIYFIAAMWGGENRIRITLKFFIYTLFGSLLMLVALIYLYNQSPAHSFSYDALKGVTMSRAAEGWIFWAFFIAFAIKIPVFPLHTWQPDTYTDAPTSGTMMLSGIMLKMGLFGLLRWLIPIVPNGVDDYGKYAVILAVVGVIYSSLIALAQSDMKRLIAYVSIAHVGLIAAGLMSQKEQGIAGGILQMLTHGVNAVGLFYVVDIIERRTKNRNINQLGGIANVNSLFAIFFMIILLGSIALPLTNGFPGEFLILTGLYKYNAWICAFGGLTIILGAYYMLKTYQKVMLGNTNALTENFAPLTGVEKTTLVIICAMVFLIGIYPNLFLDFINPVVSQFISH